MQFQVQSPLAPQFPPHIAGRVPAIPFSLRSGADERPKVQSPRVESPTADAATRERTNGKNAFGLEGIVATYKAGQTICLQGDPADAVFYIQKGKVQLTVVSKQGKQGVVAILGSGAFFAEGCMAGQQRYISTATATIDSMVVRVEKATMVRLLRDDPKFSELFMSFLLRRNLQVEDDLIDHLFNSSEKRLARLLLLLSGANADGGGQTIPRINQEVLAGRVGTTRSRINFFMNKFRKMGLIEYKGMGNLRVHNSLMEIVATE